MPESITVNAQMLKEAIRRINEDAEEVTLTILDADNLSLETKEQRFIVWSDWSVKATTKT